MTRYLKRTLAGALLFLIATVTGPAPAAADPIPLRVNMFSGPQDLAVFVAQEEGLYAKRGLAVEVSFTPNSQALREGIAKGSFEISSSGIAGSVTLCRSRR